MYDFVLDERECKAFITEKEDNIRENENNIKENEKHIATINSKNKESVSIKILKENPGPLLLSQNKAQKTGVEFFSVLKSNLQKQVRRKDLSSVSTAFMMMDIDMFELLRRLSVIAFEDSEISEETSVIVWLMCAVSKGFVLNDKWKEFILQYVKCITLHNICFRLEYTRDHTIDNTEENLSISDVCNFDNKNNKVLAGILFRNSFGGLHGDVLMISSIIDYMLKNNIPLKNFISSGTFQMSDVKSLKILTFLRNNPQLKIHEAAIDFHTYPKIVERLHYDFNTFSKEEIKSSIWFCSSGINFRKDIPIDGYYKNIWEVIKSNFYRYGKEYLQRI